MTEISNKLWLLAGMALLVTGTMIMLGSIAGVRDTKAPARAAALTREYEGDPLTIEQLSAGTDCACPLFSRL